MQSNGPHLPVLSSGFPQAMLPNALRPNPGVLIGNEDPLQW